MWRAAYEPLSKQKAPKVLADALTWVEQALVEFGIGGLSLRGLIEFLKTALKNSNAAVRTNATKTLVTVKLFAGSCKLFGNHIIRRKAPNICRSDKGSSRGSQSSTPVNHYERVRQSGR